jgi:chromosome segregation ATPase
MRITDEQRRHTEQRIRAATDALLRGEFPPDGKCDVTTLAQQAGISRAALYRSYSHLKAEFEQKRSQLQADGRTPDPRDDQIARLKAHNAELKQRIAQRDAALNDHEKFKTMATSRLAAQHDEIQRLRAAARPRTDNVRNLPSRRTTSASPIIGPC